MILILQLILAVCTAYMLKLIAEAAFAYRKKNAFQNVSEAKLSLNTVINHLGKAEHVATLGFGSGCAAVYAKLIETGSHGFEAKYLIFPLLGMTIAGVLKPFLALLLERKVSVIESEIERLEENNNSHDNELENQGAYYEVIDRQT